MKQQCFLISSLILALIFLTVPANGQNSTGNGGCNLCFRGNPKGKCCSFLILESGMLLRVSERGLPSNKAGFLITADLGLMFNNKKSSAIGASFHLAADDNGERFGIGPRFHKWLGKGVALDLSPRVLFAGSDNSVKNRYPGFAFSASLSIYELLSIDVYFDIIKYERQIFTGVFTTETVNKTQTGLYLGASGRSWAVLTMPIVSIIVIVASGGFYG